MEFFARHGHIEFFDHQITGTWRRTSGPSWDTDISYRIPPAPPDSSTARESETDA
ncbi:hypothetical protein [Sneathiella sp.]|uniref:hypothetical protein n=1 Tax=Sneathiella sp. TaxID=1964365 RepID=UPI002FE36E9F